MKKCSICGREISFFSARFERIIQGEPRCFCEDCIDNFNKVNNDNKNHSQTNTEIQNSMSKSIFQEDVCNDTTFSRKEVYLMDENLKQDNEFVESGNTSTVVTEDVLSDKSKIVAALLCFFLGMLGIHRFYLGKNGTGFLMLLLTIIGAATAVIYVGWVFIAIEGLWEVIDFFRILFGGMKDGKGKSVK